MLFDLKAIGNLTKDPEKKTTAGGTEYCQFTIAVNNRNTETYYLRVKVWGRLGESCLKYLTKGRKVYVEGELEKPYSYLNNEGKPDTSLAIRNATHVEFLGGVDRVETAKNDTGNLPESASTVSNKDKPEENVIAQAEAPKPEYVPVEADDLPF